jgi:hypothetical protein
MDLANFLEPFFNLDLLCGDHLELLTSLSNDSKAELSSCDVAWWAGASLSDLLMDGSSLPRGDCNFTKPSGKGWGTHEWFDRGVYKAIHHTMKVSGGTNTTASKYTLISPFN